MKTTICTLAFLATCVAPALADNSIPQIKTLGGCEIIDKSGYWNKVDATCEFGFANDDGEDRQFVDADNDPSTPPVRDPLGN